MPRLTLRPLDSFFGVDLKLGASVISLLGLLNKIAGVYGILALFTGGSIAQVSLYIYSIATLVLFLWGLRGIAQEKPSTAFLYAHLYALDHFVSTAYTVTFAVHWWLVTPHDGRRIASSPAQQRIIDEARKAGVGSGLDPQQAIYAAQAKWNDEKGFSALVLVASWVIKIFFLLCLYSFAMHLRRGTYRSLPTSKPGLAGTAVSSSQTASPFRRRGSAYAYSHVRNASSVSEYEMHAESGADGTKQGGSGLEDLEPTPVPSSLSQADGFASLGRPPMSVSGGGVPTVPGGAASPALMRSRSAGQ